MPGERFVALHNKAAVKKTPNTTGPARDAPLHTGTPCELGGRCAAPLKRRTLHSETWPRKTMSRVKIYDTGRTAAHGECK